MWLPSAMSTKHSLQRNRILAILKLEVLAGNEVARASSDCEGKREGGEDRGILHGRVAVGQRMWWGR